jgi:hypothetical protein
MTSFLGVVQFHSNVTQPQRVPICSVRSVELHGNDINISLGKSRLSMIP